MVFEQIEKLKRDYTDKFVEVDASRPELARFKNITGQVKTVNMSGRALVEFDAWYGRFDPFLQPQYLYVEPLGEAGLDLPVRAVTVRGRPPLRVDVRMREVNGAFVPLFQLLRLAE